MVLIMNYFVLVYFTGLFFTLINCAFFWPMVDPPIILLQYYILVLTVRCPECAVCSFHCVECSVPWSLCSVQCALCSRATARRSTFASRPSSRWVSATWRPTQTPRSCTPSSWCFWAVSADTPHFQHLNSCHRCYLICHICHHKCPRCHHHIMNKSQVSPHVSQMWSKYHR